MDHRKRDSHWPCITPCSNQGVPQYLRACVWPAHTCAGNVSKVPQNIVLGTCSPGSYVTKPPTNTTPGECSECLPGFYIAPGHAPPLLHVLMRAA